MTGDAETQGEDAQLPEAAPRELLIVDDDQRFCDRLARAMLAAAPDFTSLKAALNEPYGPKDGVTHTLKEHALEAGLLNVMIEVRNDFVGDAAGAERVAGELAGMIERGLEACDHPAATDSGKRLQG